MAKSNGPIMRSTPVDPLDVATWPVACALIWIRAVTRNWSSALTRKRVTLAYREEARAFPAWDPPLEEGRKLIDYAAARIRSAFAFIVLPAQ